VYWHSRGVIFGRSNEQVLDKRGVTDDLALLLDIRLLRDRDIGVPR